MVISILFASAVYNLFDMKSKSAGVAGGRPRNTELANKVYKP